MNLFLDCAQNSSTSCQIDHMCDECRKKFHTKSLLPKLYCVSNISDLPSVEQTCTSYCLHQLDCQRHCIKEFCGDRNQSFPTDCCSLNISPHESAPLKTSTHHPSTTPLSDPSFRWLIIILSTSVGVVLLALVACAVICRMRRLKVTPVDENSNSQQKSPTLMSTQTVSIGSQSQSQSTSRSSTASTSSTSPSLDCTVFWDCGWAKRSEPRNIPVPERAYNPSALNKSRKSHPKRVTFSKAHNKQYDISECENSNVYFVD